MPYRSTCALLCAVSVALAYGQQPTEREKAIAKIAELEKKLADLPTGTFDFGTAQRTPPPVRGGRSERSRWLTSTPSSRTSGSTGT